MWILQAHLDGERLACNQCDITGYSSLSAELYVPPQQVTSLQEVPHMAWVKHIPSAQRVVQTKEPVRLQWINQISHECQQSHARFSAIVRLQDELDQEGF